VFCWDSNYVANVQPRKAQFCKLTVQMAKFVTAYCRREFTEDI